MLSIQPLSHSCMFRPYAPSLHCILDIRPKSPRGHPTRRQILRINQSIDVVVCVIRYLPLGVALFLHFLRIRVLIVSILERASLVKSSLNNRRSWQSCGHRWHHFARPPCVLWLSAQAAQPWSSALSITLTAPSHEIVMQCLLTRFVVAIKEPHSCTF